MLPDLLVTAIKTDVANYFADEEFLAKIKVAGNYSKTVEKAHGRIETRNYYQTSDILWLFGKEKWMV